MTALCTAAQAQLYLKNRTITVADGLSDNRVTCFYKDKTGYIWIGTKNGLNRYDGHAFTVYKPAAKASISNEVINAVTGDRMGNIWIATMNGLNRFNPETGEWFTWFSDNSGGKNGLPNSLVWDIHFDDEGYLWIASDVFAFARFDPRKNEFLYYDWPAFVKTIRGRLTEPGYHAIQRFVQKSTHEFWLASNKGLVHLNTQTKQFTFLGGTYNENVHDLKWDAASASLYLSLNSGRTFLYNPEEQLYKEWFASYEPYPSASLPQSSVQHFYLACSKGLLYKQAAETWLLRRHLPFLSLSLPPGAVTTIYTDSTGLHWIGTANGFVIQYRNQHRSAFIPLFAQPEKEAVNYMSSVYYSEDDGLYYTCSLKPAAVAIIQPTNGTIKKITHDDLGKPLPGCYAVKKAEGVTWLLTEDKIFRFMNGKVVHFPTPFDGASAGFRDITSDNEGNLWFASFKKGLFFYQKSTGIFRQPGGPGSQYLKDVTTSLYFDSLTNTLWIGSYGRSLHAYQLTENKIISYVETESNRQYSYLSLCNDITADASGKIWVATNAGGLFYQTNTRANSTGFAQVDMRNGLLHNQVLSIVRGNRDILWMLTNDGLSYINTAIQPVKEIPADDAVPFSAWYSDLSIPHQLCYNKQANELAVGMAGGILFYYPNQVIPVLAFPILINKISVTSNNRLDTVAKDGNPLVFSYQTKEIQFAFSALYFGNAEISYQYRLGGYNTDWKIAGEQMHMVYQNLPAGDYDFYIRAVTKDNVVVAQSEKIHFTLKPPFWKTWKFYTLLAVLLGYAAYQVVLRLQQRVNDEKILTQITTSLYGKTVLEDILSDVARSCVELLNFKDCIFYQADLERSVLIQYTAAGNKRASNNNTLIARPEWPIGTGIIGTVAQTGIAARAGNTAKDSKYSSEEEIRFSKITVPVFVDTVLFGLIDSEHTQKNFFKRRHLRLLRRIATVCGERISKYQTEERLRSKIARDLHDEMGSTLTSINILSTVAMAKYDSNEAVQLYLQKIKDHSGKMMESMSDIVWAINPENDSIEKMLIRMKEFAAEMLEPAGINYYFETSIAKAELHLNLEQRKDVYLIFKEAINNAVKYSKATSLHFLLQCSNDVLLLRITDNGTGFDTGLSSSGNGIKNMNSRAAAMGAALQVESVKGSGTSITLQKSLT
ncbi:MAG TPA: two-component regulator propeller domain-containing protein [Ferruginibacter sp.]|nr:two-component regulator propeller domain-containing protein [Ferruginibacter sp.]HMP20911.1 two-component regulator propeller domain-containing protein [Ferruginibacter sp.]